MADNATDPNSATNATDPNGTATNTTTPIVVNSGGIGGIGGVGGYSPLAGSALGGGYALNSLYGGRFPGIYNSSTNSPLGTTQGESSGDLADARIKYNTSDVENADKNRKHLFESQTKHDSWEIAKPVILTTLAGATLIGSFAALGGAAAHPKYMSYARNFGGFGTKMYKGEGIHRTPVMKAKVGSRWANATKFGLAGVLAGALVGAGVGTMNAMR